MTAVPYAADTRAKGWRFELDYEKIEQSDTWSIAAEVPMAQPALLMMWLAAWTQEPCGSLPNDENVIRAKCRIPPKLWPSLRGVLMRGWTLADDGRLYHPTITARVLEMLDYRKKNAERVAKWKAAQGEQRAANALPTGEQPPKNDTGTGTGTGTKKEKKPSASRARRCPESFEVTSEMRSAMQAECPGVDIDRETVGFRDWEFKDAKSDWAAAWRRWIRKASADAKKSGAVLSFRERDAAAAAARVHEMTGGLASAKTPGQRAATEIFDVTPLALGR